LTASLGAGTGSAPSRRRAATWVPIGSIWISLARRCFGQRPPPRGLDFLWKFLGFPWILSSETSLINGLYGIPARKLFSQRLSRRCESARWERTMGARGGGCGSAGLFMGMSLPMFPLFRNQMLRSRVAFASVQRQAAPGERLR